MSSTPEGHSGQGHRARLRERFERAGLRGFSEHEVVELLLTLCIPRRDVKPLAKVLLQRFGSLRAILDADLAQLREIEGMGNVAPIALKIIRETTSLYLEQGLAKGPRMDSVKLIAETWLARLGGLKVEVFEVMYLDTQYQLVHDGIVRIAEGTVDRAAVYPREVIAGALRHSASFIALAHNHPSGRCEPSEQDQRLTERIIEAAQPLGIRVLDHIIIAGNDYYSFARNHRL